MTITAEEPPAARQPAPGALALVQDFVNSAELPGGYDELADTAAATLWLQAHGFPVELSEQQCRRIVETREHLRSLIEVNSGHVLDPRVADRLGRLLDSAGAKPLIQPDGVRLGSKAGGVDGFIAALLAALLEATIDGTFRRLKVCRSASCQWTFYDSSKNGRGAWCSMRVCGSRAKARAYRERRRGGEATAAASPAPAPAE